ncbi:MAG TPA: DNRLRE domain-containing protein [Polyangiaceae bacterium]
MRTRFSKEIGHKQSPVRLRALGAVLVAAGTVSCGAPDPEQVGEVEQTVGAPVAVSFQNGVLPTSAYAGTTDSSIKQATATTNFGNATSLEVDGDDGSGVDKSGAIRWALSGIPAGSIVQSASITLRTINETNNTYNVFELRRPWNESQVTWQSAATGSPWATAGALGATDRGPIVGTVTGPVGSATIPLNSAGIALVQGWVNGGTNAGVVIAHATNTNGIDFASSEHATLSYRPRLTITYLPPNSLQTALDFDGVDDHVRMGQAPGLGLSQMTLEAWIKRTGTGQSSGSGSGGVTMIPLIAKGRGETDGDTRDCNYFFGIRATDGVLAADFEDMATGANHPVAGATPVSSGVWHHVAVSYDGTTWRLYLDGRLDATLAANATPRFDSIQHFGLGTALNSTGVAAGFFDGVLDEVRVWNHARSLSQIQTGMTTPIPSASGLVGRWGLDEGSGAVAANSAGSTNGQINGATFVTPGSPFGFAAQPAPSLVAPASAASNVARPASLSARVTDPDSATHTLRFFGRPQVTSEDFSIVVLPDTQYYSESFPATYSAQTQWIRQNRDALNIEYVAHVGDIVNVASQIYQWDNANAAMSILETPLSGFPDGIPYCPSVGNHDIASGGNTTNFNSYFGVSRFQGRGYYGGHFGSDNDNHYNLFSAGGMDFIVISLEYDTTPDQPVLDWADNLLKAHPNRRAIVATHYGVGAGNPAAFGTQGRTIYDNLKDNPNLFLLLCGHICGEGQRSDVFNGRTIRSILTDYQCRASGGSGWLRIMTFSPANDTITFRTYSPTLNQYETDADSHFTLSYDMPGAAAASFAQIGSVSAVPVGTTATVSWSNLAPATTYEWYAAASDAEHTVSTASRTFTTAP